MKLNAASITLLIAVVALACVSEATEPAPGAYQWTRAIETGVKTWPRWVVPVVGGDQKLRMINDEGTWTSENGIDWLSCKSGAAGAFRPGVSQIFFNGKFWLMGGMNNWAEFTNEIWSSTDAIEWTRVVEQAPWPARRNALVVEYEKQLWLLGGAESSGQRDVLPARRFRDVWQSRNGIAWNQVSSNLPASDEQILVFQNQIWLLGAEGVWFTRDGKTWRQTAKGEPFSDRRGFGSAVYDGKMWIFGGIGKEQTTNEVWSSTDGVLWQKTESAPWFPRGAQYSTVFDGKLWIYGGKTGTTYEQADDVWFLAAGSRR